MSTATLQRSTDRRTDRACFDGMLIAALSYGALLMLFCQLAQTMFLRPKRGRIFYGIIAFSAPIFLLSTVAIGGRFRFAELIYIENRDIVNGFKAWYMDNSGRWENIMTMASVVILPWIGDLLMLYRLYVLWSYRRWILILPSIIYLADVALSIPFLIALSRPRDPNWSSNYVQYSTAYASLCTSFNLLVTILIITRLYMLRKRVEQVMGKVQSVFYTAHCTTFVESGAFFTLWQLCYIILFARKSWIQDVFLQPAVYISAITRMMIISRMAQNNAWSRDIIEASVNGVLDWQVSSAHSIPLHGNNPGNQMASFPSQDQIKSLPRKFREDEMNGIM